MMIQNARKTMPLALALLLALAATATAGDSAGATFSLTGADEIPGVRPGEKVTMQIAASGLVGVKEVDIILAASPAGAFDLAATTFEVPIGWFAPGPSPVISADRSSRATYLLSATLTTAADFTIGTGATIAVERISVGPSNSERDEFEGGDLGLSITVKPALTAVQESVLPTAVTALVQNFPNPFNPETNIRFDLGDDDSVTLMVYDAAGQMVRSLVAGEFMEAGAYSLIWDGRNTAGKMVSSGIYFYELRAGVFTSIKKMTLLK